MTSRLGRVVVVGGSGNLGRRAAAEALNAAESVVVTGVSEARATAVASRLGPRADGVGVDVTDGPRLRTVLAGCDAVLNVAAPYFRLGSAVLDAAIDVGCAYADVCDDWEATAAMLERHDEARRAGVVAVTGFGIAPGVDDAMAGVALRHLDHVDHLWTGWALDALAAAGPSGHAALDDLPGWPGVPRTLVHMLRCCVGPIRALQDGRLTDVASLELEVVPHPRFGPLDAFTIGSPEAITLGRRRPEMRSNRNVMLTAPSVASDLRALADAVRNGDLDLDEAAALLATADAPIPAGEGPPLPSVFAVARGSHAGEARTVAVDLNGTIPGGTGAAGDLLGSFPRLLVDGVVSAPGVLPVGEAVAPQQYLSLLGARHDPPRPADDLVTVTCRP